MAGEGVLLQKAREEKGWTLYDVEDSIKIRVRYLEALENEEYHILPGDTYTRGFLRTYAKHLGINSEEIIDCYKSSLDKGPTPAGHQPLTPIQSTPVWFKPIVLIVMALVAVFIVIGITYFSKINNSPPISDYNPTPLPAAPETQNNSPDPSKEALPPEVEAPVQYEGIVAEIIFKENCWLKIRIDGGTIQGGMNSAGTTKVFEGTTRIEFLTIGNAGGVTLKLNGRELPPLGASREVITNYVITEDTIKELSSS